MYGYFMQDKVTTHTEKLSLTALEEVIGEMLLTSRFWPSRLPELYMCDLYLQWTHFWQEVNDKIQRKIYSISRLELHHMFRKFFLKVIGLLSSRSALWHSSIKYGSIAEKLASYSVSHM
jgi:hypothetical protein